MSVYFPATIRCQSIIPCYWRHWLLFITRMHYYSSIASNKMTTGCHDRRRHRRMFWSWSEADLDTSAATQQKMLVASINTSMSYSVKRLSLYCDFKIWQASQAQVQLAASRQLKGKGSVSVHVEIGILCRCRPRFATSDGTQTHAPAVTVLLTSPLRRRRHYSHTSTILWLHSKDGRSAF